MSLISARAAMQCRSGFARFVGALGSFSRKQILPMDDSAESSTSPSGVVSRGRRAKAQKWLSAKMAVGRWGACCSSFDRRTLSAAVSGGL
eukprot:CAMPEP_0115355552 /NCGR_PEP_ID=MMETSP0270-20121206/99160_1 /TAXON_ID=71861 /ORGANISM="Scrippsiella trochoidea, Strain CCMP3099" /LENGTH=89 /DNA_ID=CAMNT_0002777919 /DNA_START=140 /DNA_END=409 /DNA_ORIENTATION=-